MAEGYGIWCITVGDWKRKSSKTEDWYSARDSNEDVKEKKEDSKKQGRMKDKDSWNCKCENGSEGLYLWFSLWREKGALVSGPLVQENMVISHKVFGGGESDFTASIDWIAQWIKNGMEWGRSTSVELLLANLEPHLKFCEQILIYVIHSMQW